MTELGGRPTVSDDGTIVYVFDELAVSAVASDANLVLADPALAAAGSLPAAELAELAAARGVATAGAADAGSLRDALKEWAAAQLDRPAGGAAGERSFPAWTATVTFDQAYVTCCHVLNKQDMTLEKTPNPDAARRVIFHSYHRRALPGGHPRGARDALLERRGPWRAPLLTRLSSRSRPMHSGQPMNKKRWHLERRRP